MAPGGITEAHHHVRTEEIYYFLSGQGRMHLDAEVRDVAPGDAVAIPPGAVHWIENPTPNPLVFLCCCSPGYEHEDTVLLEKA